MYSFKKKSRTRALTFPTYMYKNKTGTGRELVAPELKTSASRVHHFITALDSMVENIMKQDGQLSIFLN